MVVVVSLFSGLELPFLDGTGPLLVIIWFHDTGQPLEASLRKVGNQGCDVFWLFVLVLEPVVFCP